MLPVLASELEFAPSEVPNGLGSLGCGRIRNRISLDAQENFRDLALGKMSEHARDFQIDCFVSLHVPAPDSCTFHVGIDS